MLRFFRINDPYRLVVIFLILVIVRLIQGYFISDYSYYELKWLLLGEWLAKGFNMYTETFDYTGPFAAVIYKSLDLLLGRTPFSFYIFSTLLIILHASIFNSLLLKNKVYNENSYLPAFLYVLLIVSIPDFMTLSPQLMSLTFVLLTLRNVLRRIDNQVTDELFLTSGIYIGIASMLYLPSAVFFLVFLFSLILFTTAIFRRLALYFFGFILVFSLCWVYYYFMDSAPLFLERFLIDGLLANSSKSTPIMDLLLIAGPLGLIFLFSVFKTLGSARLTNFQQKVQQVFWIFLVGALVTFTLSIEKSVFELLFLVPVIAYFLTHYFILIRKRIAVAIMPGLVIFGLLSFSIYSYQDLTKSLTLDSTIPSKEGIMVLGEKLEVYSETEKLTPCFSHYVSKRALGRIDYYTDATLFYDLLIQSDPEIIVDELEIMTKLKFRFPYLEENYTKVDEKTYRKINN